jgi:hypothetical protein
MVTRVRIGGDVVAEVYVVRVEGNLVVSIAPSLRNAEDPPPGTPLEVGTQLATNFRETCRLDGSYVFADAEGARSFASLCLQFMKNLVEQRTKAVVALPPGFSSYTPDPQPRGGGQG